MSQDLVNSFTFDYFFQNDPAVQSSDSISFNAYIQVFCIYSQRIIFRSEFYLPIFQLNVICKNKTIYQFFDILFIVTRIYFQAHLYLHSKQRDNSLQMLKNRSRKELLTQFYILLVNLLFKALSKIQYYKNYRKQKLKMDLQPVMKVYLQIAYLKGQSKNQQNNQKSIYFVLNLKNNCKIVTPLLQQKSSGQAFQIKLKSKLISVELWDYDEARRIKKYSTQNVQQKLFSYTKEYQRDGFRLKMKIFNYEAKQIQLMTQSINKIMCQSQVIQKEKNSVNNVILKSKSMSRQTSSDSKNEQKQLQNLQIQAA